MFQRFNNRLANQLRQIKITPHYYDYAEGSCLIEMGKTKVICAATIESKVPFFLKNSGKGWITAEYSMLPRSNATRIERESVKGKQNGRTHEIQRLIGRTLRSCVNLTLLNERQIKIDCDVIQADGGTRTAAISGAYVALYLACVYAMNSKIKKLFTSWPLIDQVAAVSCGVVNKIPLLDLDYSEDSQAEVDANFVLNTSGDIVELQTSAEQSALKHDHLLEMLQMAKSGINEIMTAQNLALGIHK